MGAREGPAEEIMMLTYRRVGYGTLIFSGDATPTHKYPWLPCRCALGEDTAHPWRGSPFWSAHTTRLPFHSNPTKQHLFWRRKPRSQDDGRIANVLAIFCRSQCMIDKRFKDGSRARPQSVIKKNASWATPTGLPPAAIHPPPP